MLVKLDNIASAILNILQSHGGEQLTQPTTGVYLYNWTVIHMKCQQFLVCDSWFFVFWVRILCFARQMKINKSQSNSKYLWTCISFMCWFDNDKAYGIILNWNNQVGKQAVDSWLLATYLCHRTKYTIHFRTQYKLRTMNGQDKPAWMGQNLRVTLWHTLVDCGDVVLVMSIERNGEAWEM